MKWSFHERQKLSVAAIAGLIFAIVAAFMAVSSGLGSRLNWWHFSVGFTLLKWGVYVGIAAVLLSLLGLFASRPGGSRRGLPRSLLALIISLPVVIMPLLWMNAAQSVPPIHDITTDTENPPQFDAILALRANAPNSAEYGGKEIAAQQRQAYPDIQPLEISIAPEAAFTVALKAVKELGWEIAAQNPQKGLIEATDTTFWFGFKDDVVIRIKPQNTGSRVDIRSVSRVGRSDVGTNAARIRAFIKAFRNNLD
ncbi:MAG: DUF1499 domain-containing protein [Gammaproteobacteria bacterium]|jgi:uncharacterized protein (DUF1499 family)